MGFVLANRLQRRCLLAMAAGFAVHGISLAATSRLSLLIGYDGSASLSLAEFDANARHALRLLALTRASDSISLRRLEDARAVLSVEPTSTLTQHRKSIAELATQIAGMKKLQRGGRTLFQPVIDQFLEAIEQQARSATLASPDGRRLDSGRSVAVMTLLSDGLPDDPPVRKRPASRAMARPAPGLPAGVDWLVIGLGVHTANRPRLDELLVAAGFVDADRKLFIPPSQVGEAMPQVARLLGRSFDQGLLTTIDRSVNAVRAPAPDR